MLKILVHSCFHTAGQQVQAIMPALRPSVKVLVAYNLTRETWRKPSWNRSTDAPRAGADEQPLGCLQVFQAVNKFKAGVLSD